MIRTDVFRAMRAETADDLKLLLKNAFIEVPNFVAKILQACDILVFISFNLRSLIWVSNHLVSAVKLTDCCMSAKMPLNVL